MNISYFIIKFSCVKCDYHTCHRGHWRRHLSTAKHKMITNDNKKVPKSSKLYQCECGNNYMFASGLSRHKKKCSYKEEKTKEEDTTEETPAEEAKEEAPAEEAPAEEEKK